MQMTGVEVRKFRIEHGLSLKGLAGIIGCSYTIISDYENSVRQKSKVPWKVQELVDNEELLAEKMKSVEKGRCLKPRKRRDSIGYIPDGKSFEEYNAKLLHFSREADKLGISYGNYMAMRRAKNDSRTARNY